MISRHRSMLDEESLVIPQHEQRHDAEHAEEYVFHWRDARMLARCPRRGPVEATDIYLLREHHDAETMTW